MSPCTTSIARTRLARLAHGVVLALLLLSAQADAAPSITVSGCPPPPKSDTDGRDQWAHVLLLDSSMSMINNGIWKETREAFARHVEKLPLGSRVHFYMFNEGRDQYSPKLTKPRFESLFLTNDERMTLAAVIREAEATAKVTPLAFYYNDLLARHKDTGLLGHSFYVFTDGADESCDPKYLKRINRYLQRRGQGTYTEETCKELQVEVKRMVTSRRKGTGWFIWLVTEPSTPCNPDGTCTRGRCITLSNGDKRCIWAPRGEWLVKVQPVAQPLAFDAVDAKAKEAQVAQLVVVDRGDFPALVHTRWKEDGTKVMHVEPPGTLLPPKKANPDGSVELNTRYSVRTGLQKVPGQIKGQLEFETCWGQVKGLTPVPVTFSKSNQVPWPFLKGRQKLGGRKSGELYRWKEKKTNFLHTGTRPMKVMLWMRRGGEDKLHKGITSARLMWGPSSKPVGKLECEVKQLSRQRLKITCPAIPNKLRGASKATATSGRLVLKDNSGRLPLEKSAYWLKTDVRLPARPASFFPWWIVPLGLALLCLVVYIVRKLMQFPNVKGKLCLERQSGARVMLFADVISRFKPPEEKISFKRLYAVEDVPEGMEDGTLDLSVDRKGKIILSSGGLPVQWQDEPPPSGGVIGNVNSKGELMGTKDHVGEVKVTGYSGLILRPTSAPPLTRGD